MSRDLAARIVHQTLSGDELAEQLIAAQCRRRPLEPSARAFLRELVFGTLRHKGSLDAVIARFSEAPLKRIERRLLSILRVGLYQMLFLDEVALEVAVDAAVSEAKRKLSRRAGGFANGILRAIGRSLERLDATPEAVDPTRWLPIGVTGSGILFDRSVLSDPDTPAMHLADRWSMPVEMVSRWLEVFGPENTERIAGASNRRPTVGLRACAKSGGVQALQIELGECGIVSRPGSVEGSLLVDNPRGLFDTEAYRDGRFQVQDPTAQRVARALDPQPGERVLDLCAAPGGKATHLAELMQGQGELIAVDLDSIRLERLQQSCDRLGITMMDIQALDATEPLPFNDLFDRVLLDAPCSNTGVLARRVEARWRFDLRGLASRVDLQGRLLERAASMVRPGGWLVYSTCSLEPEEDRATVDQFLARHSDFAFDGDEWTIPSAEGWDGGYWARIRRPEESTLSSG